MKVKILLAQRNDGTMEILHSCFENQMKSPKAINAQRWASSQENIQNCRWVDSEISSKEIEIFKERALIPVQLEA